VARRGVQRISQLVRWPDNARLAMSFVVDVEPLVEPSRQDGHQKSEPGDELPIAANPPAQNFGSDGNYEYGLRAGGPRVLGVLARHRVHATFIADALVPETAPDLARSIVNGGHEVCARARLNAPAATSEAVERQMIQNAVTSIATATGTRPYGWLSRHPVTANTRRLLIDEGFAYHLEDGSDDLPFWSEDGGQAIVVLPYTLDTSDMTWSTAPGLTPEQWLAYAIETFDVLYEEGGRYPKMMSLGVHLRIIGRPGRIRAFERLVEHVRSRPRVWIATHYEIARWWASRYPVTGAGEAAPRRS
jgi:allantoinase